MKREIRWYLEASPTELNVCRDQDGGQGQERAH
jgi:hypothetical protein